MGSVGPNGTVLVRPKKKSWLSRIAGQWWERLASAIYNRDFSGQAEQYDAGSGVLDYMLNTAGQGLWGAVFPLLTIIATQLSGAEQAGMFSMAFVTATLLMYVGNYGVRTFQVSDIEETESFGAYMIQRFLTVTLMLVASWVYLRVRGYSGDMLVICEGAIVYRAVDALADVYEGRLQQEDKLYLSGISMGLRSGLAVVVFTLLLFVTRNLRLASLSLAVVAVATLVLVTIPLTLFETDRSRKWDLVEVREIFVDCFPAFAATLLYALVDNLPKYAMEASLPYDDQVYFNAIYFGSNAILMAGGFVYKPQLLRIAELWNDRSRRGRFDLLLVAMLATMAVIAAVMFVFVATIGIPLNGLLYATDFERFRTQSYLMVAAGGLAACIDLLFQVLTVLRHQAVATRIYGIAFLVSVVLSVVFVRTMGFNGAVYAYLVSHLALFGMLVAQYVVIRVGS